MNIRAMILAGLLGLPLFAGTALAVETGNPSLVEAAKLGDREAVRSLLNSRARGDVASGELAAALSWAASRNDVEIADLLLRAGADVNRANEYGATALYAAAANADPGMTAKLLTAGADPNAHLVSGETADGLMYIGPHRNYPRHLFALGGGGDSITGAFLAARILVRALQDASEKDDGVWGFTR